MKNWPLCASCCDRAYDPSVSKGECSWCKSKSMKGWVMYGQNAAPGEIRQKKWVIKPMRAIGHWDKESRELVMSDGQNARLTNGIHPSIIKGQLLSLRFYISKKIYTVGYKGDLQKCLETALQKKQEALCTSTTK